MLELDRAIKPVACAAAELNLGIPGFSSSATQVIKPVKL